MTKPIEEQLAMIDRWVRLAEKAVADDPGGFLMVAKRRTKTEWYIKRGQSGLHYLPKSQEKLARSMAQAAYARDFLKAAEKVRKELIRIQTMGGERSAAIMYHKLAAPYEKLSDARRKLIRAYVLPDKEYAAYWKALPYEGKPFAPDTPEIYTEPGERVRSKSEKMTADKLYQMGLFYRYECPCVIPGIGTLYPDFTILDLREREEVIYEHFGLMDQPDYLKNALWKIDQYQKGGYPLGRRFLCSFESSAQLIDIQAFERMIKDRFGLGKTKKPRASFP